MINYAKNSLLNPVLSTKQIAELLGFQHSQHFIRFFKKQTGSTPREYRLQLNPACFCCPALYLSPTTGTAAIAVSSVRYFSSEIFNVSVWRSSSRCVYSFMQSPRKPGLAVTSCNSPMQQYILLLYHFWIQNIPLRRNCKPMKIYRKKMLRNNSYVGMKSPHPSPGRSTVVPICPGIGAANNNDGESGPAQWGDNVLCFLQNM